tara:strand:+ start:1129 stop:1725 length:597 start_codon:yes stop_codon:yes gene_type:complete
MDKKTYIQIFIVFVILIIITIVYLDYFRNINVKKLNQSENTNIEINKGSEDLITEMFYYSEDNKGNRYEIKSEYGVINPDKSNLILMDKVSAVIFMLNGEKVFISSNKAEYDDNNNDTTFSGSVKMIYSDHKINSEYMDLSFKDQTATLYNKVNYNSSLTKLSADKIFIDFVNKNTKIQMDDEKKNILVRSNLKNVSN